MPVSVNHSLPVSGWKSAWVGLRSPLAQMAFDLHIRTGLAYVGHLIEGEAAKDLRIPGRRCATQVSCVPLGRLFGYSQTGQEHRNGYQG